MYVGPGTALSRTAGALWPSRSMILRELQTAKPKAKILGTFSTSTALVQLQLSWQIIIVTAQFSDHSLSKLKSVLSATETGTYYRVHLIVSGDVFMQSPKHDHGYHSRQEQHNHQWVHYAGEKKQQGLVITVWLYRLITYMFINLVSLWTVSGDMGQPAVTENCPWMRLNLCGKKANYCYTSLLKQHFL